MKDHNPRANRSQLTQIAKDIAFSSDLLALQASVAMAGSAPQVKEFVAAATEVRALARLGAQTAL